METYRDWIRNNVTDPNSTRRTAGKQWVYDDVPRLDVRDYPRISILNPSAISEPHGLCSNDQKFSPVVDIQVRVKKNMKMRVGSSTFNSLQLLNYVSKEITDQLKTSSFRTEVLDQDSVFYSALEFENTINTGELIQIRQLLYKNILTR